MAWMCTGSFPTMGWYSSYKANVLSVLGLKPFLILLKGLVHQKNQFYHDLLTLMSFKVCMTISHLWNKSWVCCLFVCSFNAITVNGESLSLTMKTLRHFFNVFHKSLKTEWICSFIPKIIPVMQSWIYSIITPVVIKKK